MTTMTKKLNTKHLDKIEKIESDYIPHFDIFTDEDNLTYQIKKILWNDLTLIERRIIILYAELQSMREVANKLGVSTSKTFQVINDIRIKIKNILKNANKKPFN